MTDVSLEALQPINSAGHQELTQNRQSLSVKCCIWFQFILVLWCCRASFVQQSTFMSCLCRLGLQLTVDFTDHEIHLMYISRLTHVGFPTIGKLVFLLHFHMHFHLCVHTCSSGSKCRVSPTLACVEVMLSTRPTWQLWLCPGLHHTSPTHTPVTGNRGQHLCFHLLYPGCTEFKWIALRVKNLFFLLTLVRCIYKLISSS